MNKLPIVILIFLFISCANDKNTIELFSPEYETVTFEVVEKHLAVESTLPDNFKKSMTNWFNNQIKTNGFEGDLKFTISNFKQEVSSIEDGKKVDISLSFNILINKPSLSQTISIEGNASSYGMLTGNFSLIEFDKIIQNTQNDVILRMSRELKSKI